MKKIRMLLWPVLFVLMWVAGGTQTVQAASSNIKVVVNGNEMKSDVPPQLMNGRTMVPLYFVGDAYGVKVTWDASSSTAILDDGKGKIIKFKDKQNNAYVNDKPVWVTPAPVIVNDRMFLPFRQIGDFLGATVGWEASSSTVIVNKPKQIQVNGATLNDAAVYQLPAGHFVDVYPVAKVLGYDVKTSNGQVILEQGTEKYTLSLSSGFDTSGYRNIDDHLVISPEYLAQIIDGKTEWNEDQTVCKLDKLQHITAITKTDNGISIKTEGKMDPSPFTLSDPNRIVLDFNHAKMDVSNTTVTSSLIKEVRYSQTTEAPYRARIVIELWSPATYKVTTNDGEIKVDLKEGVAPTPTPTPTPAPVPAPTPTSSGKYTIVVDPGHGGKDTGAIGTAGNAEKNLTLAVARKLQEDLKKNPNFRVVMTRSADTFPSLQDRVDIANNSGADLFLSIHANSATPTAHGTESYYQNDRSKEFASIIYKHLIDATGLYDRGLKTANYYVIKHTDMPATLVELGFLTNAKENETMLTDDFQQRVADALAAGITEYYNKHH